MSGCGGQVTQGDNLVSSVRYGSIEKPLLNGGKGGKVVKVVPTFYSADP